MLEELSLHRDKMVQMAKSLNCNYAEDLVQDIFVKLCMKPHSTLEGFFTQAGEVKTHYLFFVVRNAFIDSKRKGTYDIRHIDSIQLFEDESEDYDVLEDMMKTELYDRVIEASKTLSNYHRQLFHFKFIKGESYNSLAKATGIGRSSLVVGVSSIRQKIHEYIENNPIRR